MKGILCCSQTLRLIFHLVLIMLFPYRRGISSINMREYGRTLAIVAIARRRVNKTSVHVEARTNMHFVLPVADADIVNFNYQQISQNLKLK